MNNLLILFAMLAVSAIVLMAGVMISRPKEQDLRSAYVESLGWGAGFFFSYSALILLLEFIPSRQILGGFMS